MTTVLIWPDPNGAPIETGIGRVVHAQYKYLPRLGIELVSDPKRAQVIAAHTQQFNLPRVDVLHSHGLYWTGDNGSGRYDRWHHNANQRIMEAARRARAITVPSEWVAMPFRRDMRRDPVIIGHGVELEEFPSARQAGEYVLWNKNRAADVCDPTPATWLAEHGVEVATTFASADRPRPASLRVLGTLPSAEMREWVRGAGVYLATAQETFGIGTLEGLAAGVPVLGYDWGGTRDLVRHQVEGYLASPGDLPGLLQGLEYIRAHRPRLSDAARARARAYSWGAVMERYAMLYHQLAERPDAGGVGIVITNYNYEKFLSQAIDSALGQTVPANEVVVVDDGSTDDSRSVIEQYGHQRVKAIFQTNAGVAAARNRAIEQLQSEYVVCLDADDRLDRRFIQALLPALQADRGLGIVYSGITILWPDGRESPYDDWPPEFNWEGQSHPTVPPSNAVPSACLFRRDMWERAGGFRQEYAPGEDAEFWTRGLSIGYTAQRVTREHLFHYRVHADSASRVKTYIRVDDKMPFMRDHDYPMAAPSASPPRIRSYSRPVVSAIIPLGPGHSGYLPEAIESLLAQTVREWECIVVDDTDESDALLGTVLRPYPFVRVVSSPYVGSGPGAARNVGLERATAPLALFLDADDYLATPEGLGRMLQAHLSSGGKYIYTDWYSLTGGQRAAFQSGDYKREAWLEHPEQGIHAVTALLPTQWARAVGGFNPELPGWEESEFYAKLAYAGYCGQRLAEPLLVTRAKTGRRRDYSQQHRAELLEQLQGLIQSLAKGDEKMPSGCCGGDAEAVLAAKRAIGTLPSEYSVLSSQYTVHSSQSELEMGALLPPVVRMEFVGAQRGSMSFGAPGVIPSGRVYRGGNNVFDKFVDADPRDVQWLEGTGLWQQVIQQMPTPELAAGAGVSSGASEPDEKAAEMPPSPPAPLSKGEGGSVGEPRKKAPETKKRKRGENARRRVEAAPGVTA